MIKTDLIECAQMYVNSYFSANVLSLKTKANYDAFINDVKRFTVHKGMNNIFLDELNLSLVDEMNVFYRANTSLSNSSRIITFLQKMMDWAKIKGFVQENTISNFKTGRDKIKTVIHLESKELEKLSCSQLNEKEIEEANDMYLFQAKTGMSYGDLQTYKVIKDDICEWIINNRCKNGKEYWVPLDPEAKRIHEKYNGKLPKIRLKDYNDRIAIFASKYGIDKHLTSHTARKTFATTKYEQGWSIESIADMMGITVAILTKHYIKKSRRRLEGEVIKMLKIA